jgi:hypothetical protein
MRESLCRRIRCTAPGFTPAIMSRLAVVWRRSWKRIWRTLALGQSFMPWRGQRRRAGCTPSGVDVDVGLPPKVVANFATSEVSEEAIARITAQNPDKTLACAILNALAKGARLQKIVEVGRLRASTLAVEIGLTPVLKLSFVRV